MIRRHMFMSALAATVALSGCGGGKSGATPTPTASPTPTPTPSPTYATFPLSAPTEFNTYSAAISYTGDPATSAVTLGAASTETLSTRVRLATDSAINTGTYVMRENQEESRFCVPTGQTCTSTLVTPSAATNPEFIFRTDDATTAGKFTQVEYLNNVIPTTLTNDAGLALTRVSYANWWRGDSTAGQKRLAYTAWGYSTALSDMPTTGTVSYSDRITGRLVSTVGTTTAINKVTGTVTMNVNFATGGRLLRLAGRAGRCGLLRLGHAWRRPAAPDRRGHRQEVSRSGFTRQGRGSGSPGPLFLWRSCRSRTSAMPSSPSGRPGSH